MLATDVQIQHVLQQRRPDDSHLPAEALPWQAEYVEVLLQMDVLESTAAGVSAVAVELLVGGQAGDKLQSTSAFAQRVKTRKAALEREHNIQQVDWRRDGQTFALAAAELMSYRMREQQSQVIKHHMELELVQMLFKQVHSRRKETRKLETVQQVRGWLLCGYPVHALLAACWPCIVQPHSLLT